VQLNGGQLKIDIDLFTPYSIKGACFSFQIIDSKERNFSHLWVFDTDIPYCRESGLFRLTCTIPSLRLYMGDYMLRCYFSEPPGGELFDMISNICPFEVVMYETKRSDFTWQPEACAYIEEAEWAVHKQ
jgi:lipopolysaccharide transport system ATP-binding protein